MISANEPVPFDSVAISVFDESETVLGIVDLLGALWIAKRTTLPTRTFPLRSESAR